MLPSQYTLLDSYSGASDRSGYGMDPRHASRPQAYSHTSSPPSGYASSSSMSSAPYRTSPAHLEQPLERRHSERANDQTAAQRWAQGPRRISSPYTPSYSSSSRPLPSSFGYSTASGDSFPAFTSAGVSGSLPSYSTSSGPSISDLQLPSNSSSYYGHYSTAGQGSGHFATQAAPHMQVPSHSLSYPPICPISDQQDLSSRSDSAEGQIRVIHSRPKPQCWEHDCNGRQFSTFSNLLRHQREKSGTAAKSYCPRCGAEFTRTTARNGHMAHEKCTRQRKSSEGE
ncbi:hypothetical protein BJ546DRAFT_587895 [Cryomyces antarcticus]